MKDKFWQNSIFGTAIIGCILLIIPDLNNVTLTKDWLLLLIIEFCAQFIFNNITKDNS